MKNIFKVLLVIVLMVSIVGCNNSEENNQNDVPSTTQSQPNDNQTVSNGNILVAYFSWADNAVLDDDVDAVSSPSVIAPGNVQQLATWVQEETGGQLFSIQVKDPYPSD